MPDDPLSAFAGTPTTTPTPRRNYDDLINRHATENGVDPDLIRAVMGQESRNNPGAISPKGARGLMQLMPATAKRFGTTDIYDPDQNIRGGARYLKFLSDRYPGDIDKVLAGYNAGEGAVDKFGGIPPYRETRNYVPAVKTRYQKITGRTLGQSQQPQQPTPPTDPLTDFAGTGAPSDPLTDFAGEQTPHYSTRQPRRQRNVPTGRRGQFKPGAPAPVTPSLIDKTIPNVTDWLGGPPPLQPTFAQDRAQRVAAKKAPPSGPTTIVAQPTRPGEMVSEEITPIPGAPGFESPRKAAIRQRLQQQQQQQAAMQAEFSKNPIPAPAQPPNIEAQAEQQFSTENEDLLRQQAMIRQFTPSDVAQIKAAVADAQTMGSFSQGLNIGSQRYGSSLLKKLAAVAELSGWKYKPVADYLRRQAATGDVTLGQLEAQAPDDIKQRAGDFIANTAGQISEIYGATAVGGPVGGFAALGGLEARARQPLSPTQGWGQTALSTAEEGLIGAGFKYSKLLEGPAKTLSQRAANLGLSSVGVATSTFGVKKAFGESDEAALQAAAANTLFHAGGEVIGQVGGMLDTAARRLKTPEAPEAVTPPTPSPVEAEARARGIQVTTPLGATKPRIRPTVEQLQALQPTPKVDWTGAAEEFAARQSALANPAGVTPSVTRTSPPMEPTPKGGPPLGPPPAPGTETAQPELPGLAVKPPTTPETAYSTVTYNKREYIRHGDQWGTNVDGVWTPVSQRMSAKLDDAASDQVVNLLTGKVMKRPGGKKGGFVNVGEIQDAIKTVMDRFPQMDEKDAREYLTINRPNLFKPGVGRAEEKDLDLQDRNQAAAEIYGSRLDNAERQYTDLLHNIRADYPNWSPDRARKWVADNHPELMARLEGDLGVQELGNVERPRPQAPTAAGEFARQRAQEMAPEAAPFRPGGSPTKPQTVLERQQAIGAREQEMGISTAPYTDLTNRDIDVGPKGPKSKKGQGGYIDLNEIRAGFRAGREKLKDALDKLRAEYPHAREAELKGILMRGDDPLIGIVEQGQVTARPDVTRDAYHLDTFGRRAFEAENKWRYEPLMGRVYWDDAPATAEQKTAVENYLDRRGLPVTGHKSLLENYEDAKVARQLERTLTEPTPPTAPPFDIEQGRQQLRQGAAEITRDYNALHTHIARRQGLDVANEDNIRNYLGALRRFVSTHAPDKVELVDRAEESAFKGDYATATLQAERALSGTHQYLSQITGANLQLERLSKGKPATEAWLPILREVQRRIGEVVPQAAKTFLEEETGALTLPGGKKRRKPYDVTRAPRKGRADLEAIGYMVDPIVEKLWSTASRLIAQSRLRGVDLKTWAREHMKAIIDGDPTPFGKLPEEDKAAFQSLATQFRTWHGQNRSAALAVAARRLSQIAGEEPGKPKGVKTGPTREEFDKHMAAWNELENMPQDKLLATAKARFPETYNASPENAVDKLYQQTMKAIAGGRRRAEDWRTEIFNRLRKMETAVDKAEAAATARPEPTPFEQAAALGSKGSVPTQEPESTRNVRAHWEALERTGRPVDEASREVDPETRAEWRLKADTLIQNHGPEGAEEWLKTAPVGGVRTEASKALADYYAIASVERNDPELLVKAVKINSARTRELTETARGLAAARFDDDITTPSGALYEATKIFRQGKGRADAQLPTSVAAKVTELATARAKADAKVKKLEAEAAKKAAQTPPTPPPPRKPKIIKGGGKKEGGFLDLTAAKRFLADESGAVTLSGPQERLRRAAQRRQKAIERAVKVMEGHPDQMAFEFHNEALTRARVERNQATFDLLNMLSAMEANNQGYYSNLTRLTRSAMVSAMKTGMRNLQTQIARSGVERATDLAEVMVRRVMGLDTPMDAKDIWRNTTRLFKRHQTEFARQILGEHPELYRRMYQTLGGDVLNSLPDELATGASKIFRPAHEVMNYFNTFNRIQEFHVRSAEFLADLELHIKKGTGLTLEQYIARRGAASLPDRFLNKAVQKALDVTFANSPPLDTRLGQGLTGMIKVLNMIPPTMSPAAFPRFMYNQLKFLWQYNPVTGMADIGRLAYRNSQTRTAIADLKANRSEYTAKEYDRKLAKMEDSLHNLPRAVGRWMVGATLFGAAYGLRSSGAAGEKWYELKTPFGAVDVRPFGPFSTYLFLAEAVRRQVKHERQFTFPELAQAFGASTSPGGLSEAAVERLYNYYSRGDWDRVQHMLASEIGDEARALLTPVRQLKDIAGQFDPKERITRDTDAAPITGAIRESIPGMSQGLPAAYRPLSAQPIQSRFPLGNITGFRAIMPKNFIEKEADRLHFQPSEIRSYTGQDNLDRAINQHMGEIAEKVSTKLQNDPRYTKATQGVQYAILKHQFQGMFQSALGQAAKEYPKEYLAFRQSRMPKWQRQIIEERQKAAPPQ